jgi:hypothetical protein
MRAGRLASRSTTGATGLLVGTTLGLLALGPGLRRGYLLTYDMVFVPDQPLTATVLGTDGSVPRSVPNDLVVVLASHLLPADIVQKVLLLGAFALAGWGVGRLMPTRLAAAVATAAFVWNAYVFERLVIGHWGFLLGLAALPWTAGAVLAVRRSAPGSVARLCLVIALVGLAGSTPLLLNVLLMVVLMAGPGARGRVRALMTASAVAAGAAAPWLVPALLDPPARPADPAGVAAFAARADTPLGVLGSVLTSGGIWNPAVWPQERSSALLTVTVLTLLAAAVAAGLPVLWRSWRGGGSMVVVAGAVGLALSLAGAVAGVDDVLRAAVVHVPGGGLLRDGQKFVALVVLPLALCAGLAAQRSARHLREGAWLLTLVPLAVLPSLAWGAHGRLDAVSYPGSWAGMRRAVEPLARAGSGDVAVFPFTYYRRFAWNGNRVVLDPTPRFLDAHVVVNDDLELSDRVVRGEDARAARIRTGLARRTPVGRLLAREHIRVVVEQLDQPDPEHQRARLKALPLLWSQGDLAVRAVPGGAARHRPTRPPAGLVIGALTLAGAAVAVLLPRGRTRWYARGT